MNNKIYIIVAVDENFGIGKDGKMPWDLKDEIKYFQDITTKTNDPNKQNMVIMGRTTWESIPEKHRPLKNRHNLVLTRDPYYVAEGAKIFHSLNESLIYARGFDSAEKVFVIGGAQVFKEIMARPDLDGVYLTRIHKTYDCDTFFPEISEKFGEPVKLGGTEEDDISYEYLFYEKK